MGGQSEVMSLLAYSLRRAAGSLLVLLVVIWLLLFAVAHIRVAPYHPGERGPLFELPWNTLQPSVAHTWNTGALEVGVAFFAVLAAVGLWRLRPRMQKFWVQLATGTLLLAFGLASFGVALANQDYRRLNTECPPVSRSCIPPDIARSMARQFNRGTNPTPWWIAGSFSTCLGLIVIGSSLVVRRRASAA